MSRSPSAPTRELVHEIASYLGRHPRAEDTVEGIAEWWLLEQQIVRQTALVQEALAVLTANGLVRQRKGHDGRIYYRLDPLRTGELRTFLQTQNRPRDP